MFNYNGFDFTNLGINESEMIVAIGSNLSAINTTVRDDAAEIQTFLEDQMIPGGGEGSFLKDFHLDPETKEGFYDQNGNGMWDSDDDNLDKIGDH